MWILIKNSFYHTDGTLLAKCKLDHPPKLALFASMITDTKTIETVCDLHKSTSHRRESEAVKKKFHISQDKFKVYVWIGLCRNLPSNLSLRSFEAEVNYSFR